MKITKNVIQDLLPLYLADEVSDDTRALVEAYLESDPELAARVNQFSADQVPADIPVSLTQDNEMEAYQKAKRWLAFRTLLLAIFIAVICIIPILAFFISAP
jgi:anti-sigma factor RsiW